MTTAQSCDTAAAVTFVEPMPGFDCDTSFTMAPIDPDGVLLSLRSERDASLRFVLTPAECFFDDYRPQLPRTVTDTLGAAEHLRLLLVLTITAGLADATANMRAPIALAPATGRAVQVVLDDDALAMRRPLVPAMADA